MDKSWIGLNLEKKNTLHGKRPQLLVTDEFAFDCLQKEIDNIEDDKLTKGRIRAIYVLQYGSMNIIEVADHHKLPVDLIRDIWEGKRFRKITEDL